MTPNLTDLIARIEAATGPDRELDRDIAIALFEPDATYDRARKPILQDYPRAEQYELVGFSGVNVRSAPCVTASIDASLALAERVLPGCKGGVSFGRTQQWAILLTNANHHHHADAATPPLAVLAATLTALRALRQGGA